MTRPPYTKHSFTTKRIWAQYQKLLKRLRIAIQTGRFYKLPQAHQTQLLSTLKRYLSRLSALKFAAKKVAIGTTLLTTLLTATTGNAQNYVQPPCSNALGFVDVGTNSYPTFVDINGDGTKDAFVGSNSGEVAFFINSGTPTNPTFVEVIGAGNPLNGVDVGLDAIPFFVDIDNNGTIDLFIGDDLGKIAFFKNEGTTTNPVFNQQLGALNPFDGVDVGNSSAPNFVDIDADGDLDAFVLGNVFTVGQINFFRNDGTASAPNFIPITGAANPFNTAPVGGDPSITFVDQDKDGDFDAFIGSNLGTVLYYQNNGSPVAPSYILGSDSANPFSGIDVGLNSTLIPNPCFVDINGDGNMDVFIGNANGTINYFENNPNIQCDQFGLIKTTGSDNPINGQDVGRFSFPELADIDGDGDFDLFVANEAGNINFFRNDGTINNPIFTPITSSNNPFDGVDIEDDAKIGFVDVDGDNDIDAFIGERDGTINFFRNDGSLTNPDFVEISGGGNPFDGVDVGSQSSPTFADIDNDGDLDAFIGNKDGQILFFRNDGSATSPNYVPITTSSNPFFGVDLEGNFTPDFGDIDNDGDLDALIGNKTGNLFYFRNDGTATSPKFVGFYGDCNPFSNILPTLMAGQEYSAPALIDINNDGLLDIFTGQRDGTVCFVEQQFNQLVAPPVEEEKIPTMSEWGRLIFGLLVLNLGLILLRRLEWLEGKN